MAEKGCVHIYCGDGKGKTTAAAGLAVRAAGAGKKVLFFQFMKDNTSSERNILEQIENITCVPGRAEEKFSFQMSEDERRKSRQYYAETFADLCEAAASYQMVIFDELICAVQCGFLPEEEVIRFLEEKPEALEVVLTGNVPGERLLALADYVTEMKKVKHPYDRGLAARMGIER